MKSDSPRATWFMVFLVLAIACYTSALEADEKTVGTSPARQLVLELPKGETKTIPVGAHPYIEKDIITLLPGDKIIVEFEIINELPKNPKVVEKNVHPERTLELEMIHDPKATMVTRKSGFAKKLTMKSSFLVLGADSMQKANMDPLENLPSFEGFDATTYCVRFYDFGLQP